MNRDTALDVSEIVEEMEELAIRLGVKRPGGSKQHPPSAAPAAAAVGVPRPKPKLPPATAAAALPVPRPKLAWAVSGKKRPQAS
jgi:hypothetical protein